MTLVEHETIFGRLVTGWDVEQWVLALLRKWSGTYLSELERQHGYTAGTFERVRGWVLSPATFDKWPEDQTPAVLVMTPGLVPPPVKDGDGIYSARWRVDIGVLISARTQEKSRELAHLFLTAHKAIVAHRPSLEVGAGPVDWIDESYDPLDYDDTRTLYAGYATFAVEVDDVLTACVGPAMPDAPLVPDTTPWPPWKDVLTADVEVEQYVPPDPIPPWDETEREES